MHRGMVREETRRKRAEKEGGGDAEGGRDEEREETVLNPPSHPRLTPVPVSTLLQKLVSLQLEVVCSSDPLSFGRLSISSSDKDDGDRQAVMEMRPLTVLLCGYESCPLLTSV
ncbi:hypothetical protein Q5P01_014645 [Channa striata]|uniref:Uncharacterized protein n=1 Tax=Channa striata TaxID=64152 RepID=A0AA88MJ51_CHASR|nr:hypothetical protein Q5P01_014645 [Channa striata]